jgi:hypothetical protein
MPVVAVLQLLLKLALDPLFLFFEQVLELFFHVPHELFPEFELLCNQFVQSLEFLPVKINSFEPLNLRLHHFGDFSFDSVSKLVHFFHILLQ